MTTKNSNKSYIVYTKSDYLKDLEKDSYVVESATSLENGKQNKVMIYFLL